jgi:hypothetical protein
MSTKDIVLSFVEAVCWYGLIYTLLYSIKHDVNLYTSALIMLGFVYVGSVSSPFFRHSGAWKAMWSSK